jgi:hypothetical protein
VRPWQPALDSSGARATEDFDPKAVNRQAFAKASAAGTASDG